MADSNSNTFAVGSQGSDIPAEVFVGLSKDPSNYRLDTYNNREAIDILNIPDSMFMADAYSGQGGFLNGKYLVPHVRESDYNRRRQLGYYRNFLRPIVRAKVDPIFGETFQRMIDDDVQSDNVFTMFIDDCDNQGTSLHDYMHKWTLDAVLQGVSFTVMDNYSEGEKPATAGDMEDKRAFPYVYMKSKGDVADYEVDDYGNIETITFKDKPVKVKDDKGRVKEEERFRKWTENDSQLMKYNRKTREYTPVEAPVVHGLGEIPVFPFITAKRDDVTNLLVASEMWDIAKLNWTIYNIDSELRESVRNQGFSILYYEGDSQTLLTLGTANALGLPTGTKIIPGFASPDVKIPDMLMAYSESVRGSMFAMAEQEGVTGVKNQLSGEAKAWDFQAHGETLKALSKLACSAECWMAKMFGLYMGGAFDYCPEYPENFQPRGALENVNLFQAALDNNISPKANALAKKRMVREVFSDEDAEVIDEIDKDIDSQTEAQAGTMANAAADAAEKTAAAMLAMGTKKEDAMMAP